MTGCPIQNFFFTYKNPLIIYIYIYYVLSRSQAKIETFGEIIHRGGVSGLSVCIWKPMFMTCGTCDQTVKLWNYKTRSVVLTEQYSEDVLDVALHPTGLYAVVVMASRALFTVIGPNGLKERMVFDIANCRMAKFSLSGHMMAFVIDGNHIHIYCAITFEKRFHFEGHKAKVKGTKCSITNLEYTSHLPK